MTDAAPVMNRIYKLEPILDDPRYEGFAQRHHPFSFRSGKSLAADFLPEAINSRDWKPPSLSGVWQPLEVVGRVRKLNDYPCLNLSIPALSDRAVSALRDMLEPNGELLPLVSDVGDYWAYNVTTVADVLDVKRSVIRWNKKPFLASRIDRYEFLPTLVDNLTIFQIPEMAGRVYVTNAFRNRVNEFGLQGFNFIRLWPDPSAEGWRDRGRSPFRQREATGQSPEQAIKGNTVVVRMLLPHQEQKPDEADLGRAAACLDQLDSLLTDSELTTPYLGSLEGHDSVDGEVRAIISCPDADALAGHLQLLLRKFDWPGKVEVVKRYGHYTDRDAQEVVTGL